MFQGREYDAGLNLYHYRARAYDPIMGRFLQTDPMGYQDSLNLYQGMNMNPWNYLDPWGERLFINPTDPRACSFFEMLTDLSDDDLTLDANGEVTISRMNRGNKKTEKKQLGTMLLRLLIDHPTNIATIYSRDKRPGKKDKFPWNLGLESENYVYAKDNHNKSNGIGTDSVVVIDPEKYGDPWLKSPAGEYIKNGPVFLSKIATFSHELIHAMHNMYGVSLINLHAVAKHEKGKDDTNLEELMTVGLSKYITHINGQPGSVWENLFRRIKNLNKIFWEITENAIRKEQAREGQYYERIEY